MKSMFKKIISLFICVFLLCGCFNSKTEDNVVTNSSNDSENNKVSTDDNSENSNNYSSNTFESEKITEEELEELVSKSYDSNYMSDSQKNMYTKLNEYANEIYVNNNYSKYKIDEDYYFISLSNLKNDFNYDTSYFESCNFSQSGFYIDPANKFGMSKVADGYPIITLLFGC